MQFLESLLSSLTLSAIAVAVATWLVGSAVYRLYLSPIAKFPGPKLAALTYWYEFYYDVIKDGGGKYTRKIEELHEIYGMPPFRNAVLPNPKTCFLLMRASG